MDRHAVSTDQLRIHYQVAGQGATALLFVHGWLGNTAWWSAQLAHFADRFTVAAIDLPGHGQSDTARRAWSAHQYAEDIRAVADQLDAARIILVGHSMSGAYVLEASRLIPRTAAIVLIDTLKDLDQIMPPQQVEQMLGLYRADFKAAVEQVLPQYLFAPTTPPEIRARLQREFLQHDPGLAVRVIEPLYRMDVREAARRVEVPVRAINSDAAPTEVEHNRKYLRDFDCVTIAGTGHYPMLERPDELNRLLDDVLRGLTPAG